jgi:PPM family protein phosphatase
MPVLACGATSTGNRAGLNEDAFCAIESLGLLAVADGLGGRTAGEIASETAIAVLQTALRRQVTGDGGTPAVPVQDILRGAVDEANRAIYGRAASSPSYQGMGSTLTACLVAGDVAHVAHIGDSRAYLLRAGGCEQLTQDHTLAALRRQGTTSTVRRGDPARSTQDGRQLLASLGTSPWASIDLFSQALRNGDQLLLCTDGVSTVVTEEELAAIGRGASSPASRCEQILALVAQRGGNDNATAVIAQYWESVL